MATTLQVILNSDVPNLGSSGELVKVRPGFARNYLLPRQLAVPATTAAVNRINHEKAVAVAKAEKNKKAMQELATKLGALKISLARPVGEDDKLFGSVTAKEIESEVKRLIDQSVVLSKAAAPPTPERLLTDVYVSY